MKWELRILTRGEQYRRNMQVRLRRCFTSGETSMIRTEPDLAAVRYDYLRIMAKRGDAEAIRALNAMNGRDAVRTPCVAEWIDAETSDTSYRPTTGDCRPSSESTRRNAHTECMSLWFCRET